MSPEFLLTAFIVCLAPGIGVIYTLSVSLSSGWRAGLLAVLGCTLATAAHLSFALAGLAAVLHASALLFQTIKWLGVAYLLWMAWGTLRGTSALQVETERPASAARIVWRGILLNLLNPKLPLFFVAFLPQFVTETGPQATQQLITLGLGFTSMTFAVFVIYALLAGTMRRAVLNSPRAMAWLRRAFAASFAALGLRLAFERA
ncbi:LysE family translocator [Thalassovita taeanensis]|uniref:Threonine/homoserine/homoserine lactone efflux protein n=1 Tax=Thalassovita taeanensis TaxID=657014 RepID=A0A1H9B3Z6_9RHOB|nr:LysE family translocator [Thalassovita taeanensis]SEP83441.1 Threonine/homoserine/homoserine lactone efflux protein [Thalassovita taeanensis]